MKTNFNDYADNSIPDLNWMRSLPCIGHRIKVRVVFGGEHAHQEDMCQGLVMLCFLDDIR